jgi:YbgC/YbaW family acyl-CoA thioester hydrolase
MLDFVSIKNEIGLFRHVFSERVKYDEVDSMSVVHNVRYFYWLERARLEYLRFIGYPVSSTTIDKDLTLMVVHAEIDYLDSLHFDEEYEVLTRVSLVRNTSLEHRNIIKKKDGTIAAIASAILVHILPGNFKPERIPDQLRELIANFEGTNVQFTEA